jgi:DNA-binding transcriptional LysR family regulator
MDSLPRPNLLALRELSAQGTMIAAADVLGVTPGAISQQIAVLESRLGIALIKKAGRRVQLTDAGQVLVQHGARILAAQDEALSALEATRTDVAGRVVIGVFGSAASVLPEILAEVARLHQSIEIRSREIDVDSALSAVRRARVDLAFGLDYADAPIPRDDAVAFHPLRTERFALAMAWGEGLVGQPMDLAQARGWDWILPPAESHYGHAMRSACRRAGFEPSVVHEVTDTAASLALAAAGAGVTPVTPLMRSINPDARLAVVPIRQDVTRSLCLAEQMGSEHRPSARVVAHVVRDILATPTI